MAYTTRPDSSSGMAHPLPLLKNACTLSLKREHRERKRMEIRKPGAAELKPALALAWDVFLKDAASGFSDEGIRTFKRFIEYDSMAATLANGTTTMWAAFSGLEPIGVIAARESHICLFFVGEWITAMVIIILILGVLAGIASNNMQYMITDSAPEAPDFANGMFLTSANLGTTIGTAICGAFITEMGTRYSVFGAFLFLIASIVFVYLRVRMPHSRKQVKMDILAE